MIRFADKDGDGFVNLSDFIQHMKELGLIPEKPEKTEKSKE